jgi:hypothetical protein
MFAPKSDSTPSAGRQPRYNKVQVRKPNALLFAAHLRLTSWCEQSKFSSVSATEIINELPKLTQAELRLVRQRLLELAAQNQDIADCNQAALEGAIMLDRMEDLDAGHQSR